MSTYDSWLADDTPRPKCKERGCDHDASPDPADEGRCSTCADERRAEARGDI